MILNCPNANCPPHSFQDKRYNGKRVFTDGGPTGKKVRCTVCGEAIFKPGDK